MKCSVIVANFNHADVILAALKSIEAQSYSDWEIILVDDASTDNSVKVINAYFATVQDQTKYKLIQLPENKGLGNAKRVGVSESTGEVVAICDPDDELHPSALEKAIQSHHTHLDASIVYTNFYRCNSDLEILSLGSHAGNINTCNLLEDKISAFFTFKRDAYNKTSGINPDFRLAEDKDIYYKLEETGNVIYINEPLYYYRIWDKGISQGFDNYVLSRDYHLLAIRDAVERRKQSGIKQISKVQLHHLLAEVHLLQAEGLVYSQQKLGSKFLKHLGLAILYNPLGSIKRKLKTAFILSRVKRNLLKLKYKLPVHDNAEHIA